MENELRNPITFISANQCPECLGEMKLVESDTTEILLTKEGVPNNLNVTEFNTKLKCMKCGKEYDVKKQGIYYGIDHHLLDTKNVIRNNNIELSVTNPFGSCDVEIKDYTEF